MLGNISQKKWWTQFVEQLYNFPPSQKFIDVNTLCLTFHNPSFFTGVCIFSTFCQFFIWSYLRGWDGSWMVDRRQLLIVNFLFNFPAMGFWPLCILFFFGALSHVRVGSWQGWRWSRKEEKPQRILFPPQTNPQNGSHKNNVKQTLWQKTT